jgi:indole-3-acetate monooxygenase
MTTALELAANQGSLTNEDVNVDEAVTLLAAMRDLDPLFRDKASENEANGKLIPEVFGALRRLNIHKLLVPRSLGGYELSPTAAMSILEQIAYSDGSTGWVAFVMANSAAMAAAYLPDSGAQKIFTSGADVMCGAGAPTGTATKVDGGYKLRGRWSYGSGIHHCDLTHSGAILYKDGKPVLDSDGQPQLMIVHAPADAISFHGNWDSLGLRASGSVDYAIEDAFVPDDYIFPLRNLVPMRRPDLFSVGAIDINAIGHSAWAVGVGRRMLDEIAAFARSKNTARLKTASAGRDLPDSDSFWESFARAEASVRSARAFLYEVWRNVQARMKSGEESTPRETTLIRLSLNKVHTAATEAADFGYLAGGGTALRNGILQRIFRDIHTGSQHVTVSQGVLRACGKELAGLAPGKKWSLYELVDA